ncbi:MAG: glycosyltransferase [Solirubrobacteraceae bacterium]
MNVPGSRPSVSVVVPFAGADHQLEAVLAALRSLALTLAPGDEILLADNGPTGARAVPFPASVRRVVAAGPRAAGAARNRGAAEARGEWLVFLDADARPRPGLLEAYFTPAPGPNTAVLAGGIRDTPSRDTRAARHSAGRGQMSQDRTLSRTGRPYAQTANCAVRRVAFSAVDGFDAQARFGEDADLCWRLAAAGWGLEVRAGALVEHASRPTLAALLTQVAGHGAGAAWLERRYPGEFPAPGARALARRCARSAVNAGAGLSRGRRSEAADAAIELLETLGFAVGRRLSNRPPDDSGRRLFGRGRWA